MTATFDHRSGRLSRRDVVLVGAAAAVSLLLSPFTAIYAVLLGVPVALVGWALSRGGRRPAARRMSLLAVGVALGAVPYIAAGLLTPDGSSGGSGSGS
jgi:ABC-type spermidine/putrescine transport system permease subunit II